MSSPSPVETMLLYIPHTLSCLDCLELSGTFDGRTVTVSDGAVQIQMLPPHLHHLSGG